VAGAVLGALVGKFAGLPGMLIGGVVGFVGGQLLSHVLFPQSQYQQGYYSYDPYNNVGNFRNASLPGHLGSEVAVKPAAPVSDDRLSSLQQAYFSALKAAEDAAKSGSDATASRPTRTSSPRSRPTATPSAPPRATSY